MEQTAAQKDSVAVIGGGTMGCDIAAIFYAAGWHAEIMEPNPATCAALQQTVPAAARLTGIHRPGGSLATCNSIQAIDWSTVRLVIECGPENLEVKQQIFAALEQVAPAHVPLTSNSSGIPISRIGEHCRSRERMLGLHFFMPAHLVPAVEVVRSEFVNEASVATVNAIMRAVRKKPVQVKKDVPGFLANRIQHAMMREAIALVDEGFASAEDVDLAVRYGFGFRYIAAGPLLQKDLAGIDIHCAAAASIYPHLHNDAQPARLMQDLVASGNYGVKSPGRRGFYQWDDDRVAREQVRYQVALAKAMQILRDEEALE